MVKDAAITVRIPSTLKRALEARAIAQRRSLSAQVATDLERAVGSDAPVGAKGRFLGLYDGAALPTDADLEEVRRLLWGNLGRPERHG